MPDSVGQGNRAETERFVLTNRHGKRIAGLIDYPAGAGPVPDVLVVCHGYGGDKDGEYLDAMKRAKSLNGPDLRDAIASTKGFQGATGAITLNSERNADKGAVIIEVSGGKFKFKEAVAKL